MASMSGAGAALPQGGAALQGDAGGRRPWQAAGAGASVIVEWELVSFVDAIGNIEGEAQGRPPVARDVVDQMADTRLDFKQDERAAAHEANTCKPCIFDYHGVCSKGGACNHCHLGHSAKQLRRAQPSRLKRDRLRQRLIYGVEEPLNCAQVAQTDAMRQDFGGDSRNGATGSASSQGDIGGPWSPLHRQRGPSMLALDIMPTDC